MHYSDTWSKQIAILPPGFFFILMSRVGIFEWHKWNLNKCSFSFGSDDLDHFYHVSLQVSKMTTLKMAVFLCFATINIPSCGNTQNLEIHRDNRIINAPGMLSRNLKVGNGTNMEICYEDPLGEIYYCPDDSICCTPGSPFSKCCPEDEPLCLGLLCCSVDAPLPCGIFCCDIGSTCCVTKCCDFDETCCGSGNCCNATETCDQTTKKCVKTIV